MTDQERELMGQHSAYCQQQFEAGKLLLYGPVLAPEGAFGVGILEVADEAEARQFGEDDPSVRARMNRFAIYPMRVAGARGKS
ncbi:MAG: YciI family protein [Candidatus Korobacteraceae bacterium]